MKNRIAALVIAAAAPLASADVFFGTYTPSQADIFLDSNNNIQPDPFRYQLREHDAAASASVQDDFGTFFTLINVFNTAFSNNLLYNEFVADSTFTASHISLAVSRSTLATDTLVGVSVQKWDADASAWVLPDSTNPVGFAGARLRAAGIPFDSSNEPIDMSLAFGGNSTGSPANFSATPLTIEAGERYRLVIGGVAGGQGGFNLHLSNVAADTLGGVGLDDDPTMGSGASVYMSGFDANQFVGTYSEPGFQFAYAFTDGNPIPAPASLSLLGLGMLALRRSR